jgi:hypothetical protein
MLVFAALLFTMGVSLADERAVRGMIQGKLRQGDAIESVRKLGANSTPTWFLENGERYSGALPLEDVRRLLDAASPK